MDQLPITERTAETVEQALCEELVRGDELIAAARPVLRHLLATDDRGWFSDERIARVRGMMLDVAHQLLFAEAEEADIRDRAGFVAANEDVLVEALCEDSALLTHAHALALEAELAERLRVRKGIDSVLSPLIEDLAAGRDGAMAGLAMNVLAAQARFLQHCRRMELPLRELPGDVFHEVLLVLRSQGASEVAEDRLREAYEEAAGRLALTARLFLGLGPQVSRALSIEHAGLAIFTTALAMASGQERDPAMLSLVDRRYARFALALRAVGLDEPAVAEQFLCLDLEATLPDGFGLIGAERAAALLAAARTEAAF